MIITLITLGRLLEARAKAGTGEATDGPRAAVETAEPAALINTGGGFR